MSKTIIFFSFIVITMAQTAFAQSKACLDEKEKANNMKKKCMEVNKSKGTDEFNKCLEGLKAQVAKASKICEVGSQEHATPPAKTPAVATKKKDPAPAKETHFSEPEKEDDKTTDVEEKPIPKEQEPQKNSFAKTKEPEEGEEDDGSVSSTVRVKGVSDKCIEELVELPNTKANFSMTSFPQELATAVVKVQGGAKLGNIPLLGSMLGPGPDNKLTEAGITVGCAKEMPTDVSKIKSLMMIVGLEMGKSAVAKKLEVKKNEIPSNISELKDFTIKTATAKTSEVLGIDASEVPTDLKGMENLISENIKKQAAKKLGVEKSSIPNDKSELSGFIKKSAKTKIANELGIKPAEVNLSKASLAEYAKEEESLAPVANLVNAANILEVLGLVNGLSALTGGGNGDSDGTSIVARAAADDDEENKSKQASKSEEMRFGARVNFSVPRVYPTSFILKPDESEVYADGGFGGGLGIFVLIPISSFHLVLEMSGQRREPININNDMHSLSITEVAVEVPLMLRFLYSEDNSVYFGVGVFGGMVLDLTEYPPATDGTNGIKDFRSKDYGAVLELGFRINDNFSADVRGTASAASFGIGEYLYANETPRLIQAQIGVSYTF